MAENIQETQEAVTRTPTGVVRNTVVATNAPSSGTATAVRVINLIVGILLSLLAIRFVLSLLGANQDNGFANFIYAVTYPFVAPFFGLFGYTMKYGVARLELETLAAMAIYALIGYGIVKAVTINRNR